MKRNIPESNDIPYEMRNDMFNENVCFSLWNELYMMYTVHIISNLL